VFKFCSPTRSAIQSGRNPIHVNVQNVGPTYVNPADPVAGFSAIARNMTGMAQHMKDAGYSTAMVGKCERAFVIQLDCHSHIRCWHSVGDAGMATDDHTPMGRGYDQSLFYFHHANGTNTKIDSTHSPPIHSPPPHSHSTPTPPYHPTTTSPVTSSSSTPHLFRSNRASCTYFGEDYWTYSVAGCQSQAVKLRNETSAPDGTYDAAPVLDNTVDSEAESPKGCPAKFVIKEDVGVCGVKGAATQEKPVANVSACCDWCSSDPHCVGWTFHSDQAPNPKGYRACYICNETKGGKNPNRTSGCVGDACNFENRGTTDLYANNGPATTQKHRGSPGQCYGQNTSFPWPANESGCMYEDALFEEEVTRIVKAHDPRCVWVYAWVYGCRSVEVQECRSVGV
jgi:hypothetical protein